MNSEHVDIWITRHALTKGVFKTTGKLVAKNTVKIDTHGKACYHKPDFHFTSTGAALRILDMIDAKRISIKKILVKLDGIEENARALWMENAPKETAD